jgi:hypothetical protein
MARMRSRLLVVAILALTATACSVPGSQSRAEKVSDCEDGFLDEAHKATGSDAEFSSPEARANIRELCGKLIDAGAEAVDDPEELQKFVAERPDLAAEMCAIAAPSAYAQLPAAARKYVAVADMERLLREGCRFAAADGQAVFDENFDVSGTLGEHPELAEPFCVAGMLNTYDTQYTPAQRAAAPRAAFRELSHRVYTKAIESGILDFGSGNLGTPKVDQGKMTRLFARTVEDMRASGELPRKPKS